MEKLLLIDGMNLLFQMFYGMPERIIGKHGKPIHGTLGFVGALLRMLRVERPTHVAVLFDGETCNPRKLLDENYKANRPDYQDMPEEEIPFSQLPDIYAALKHLGIAYAETADCETDDWVAGFCLRYGGNMDIVVASQDSDFFQLITDRVKILRYRGERSMLCDSRYIQEKLGIVPSQYAAWKSLVGDSADNIKGAPGVGPKTAAALLAQFGDLESILQNADAIQKPSVRASVQQSADRIRKNDALIRLSGCQCLPFSLEELKYTYLGHSTWEVLHAIGLR